MSKRENGIILSYKNKYLESKRTMELEIAQKRVVFYLVNCLKDTLKLGENKQY
ncbi:hypothetical protein [Ilyobacter polytropus]|uniref:hypothetical protein n=1 Tax=Ilyobacter polytropus TaxID=167642 RepID=UPI00031D28CD|nr:hypothetical protein [Ilyobacter polytropus]